MGRKKIQKQPKTPKAAEPDNNDSQPDVPQPQQPEAEKAEEPQSAGKQAPKKRGRAKHSDSNERKQAKETKEVELFSQGFNQKIQSFKNFYKQYLDLRSISGNGNPAQEFKRITDEVRGKIEKACSQVLKQNVSDAQKWIEKQKAAIKQQIKVVENLQIETRKNFSKIFSQAETTNQTEGIRNKKAVLQQSLKQLQQIRAKTQKLCSSGNSMDEE